MHGGFRTPPGRRPGWPARFGRMEYSPGPQQDPGYSPVSCGWGRTASRSECAITNFSERMLWSQFLAQPALFLRPTSATLARLLLGLLLTWGLHSGFGLVRLLFFLWSANCTRFRAAPAARGANCTRFGAASAALSFLGGAPDRRTGARKQTSNTKTCKELLKLFFLHHLPPFHSSAKNLSRRPRLG